ncbi:hypothetical protein Tco_0865592 [Tanacetum coccineum]
MVAYLKKPERSEGFHQIVDFLNASHIRTLDNGEIELTATIDGKVKIVTEAFGPVVQGEGSTHPEFVVPQPRSPTQSLVADEATSTSEDVRYGGATTTVTSLEAGQGSGNIDKTPTMPHDLPLPRVNTLGSGEGSMTLQELMVLCTTLSKKVESLETDLKQTKLTYGAAYTKLIKKDPSKQGRKIDEIDQDPNISLVQHDAELQGRNEHDMEFDFDLDATKDVSTAKKDVSTAKPVSTTGAVVTTASVAAVSTASPTRRVSTTDDINMAETLVYIRKSATKDKGKGKMDESEPV